MTYSRPLEKQQVSNIERHETLNKALHFVPGRKLNFSIFSDDGKTSAVTLIVKADAFNNTFIEDAESKSKAWFISEAGMTYFTHFEGSKASFLYLLFLGLYRSVAGFYRGLDIRDAFTLSIISNKYNMILQDFLAPFYTYLRAEYQMEYVNMEDEISGNSIELHSMARVRTGKHIRKQYEFWFKIESGRLAKIYISTPSTNIEAIWEKAEF
jgi:hypothetical protein